MSSEPNFTIFSTELEPFPISDIALVRVLDGPPKTVDGQFVLETAFQKTQPGRSIRSLNDGTMPRKPIPRITLHFSLNDCVADTALGENSWISSDYVVVGGLEESMKMNQNASLVNLMGADTYFEVPPNVLFRMPENSVLIKPGNPDTTSGILKPDNIVIYKAYGYSEDEVHEVVNGIGYRIIISNFIALREDLDSEVSESEYKTYLNAVCKDFYKRKAVHKVLVEQGYQVLPSGDDRWMDNNADLRLQRTAKSLNVSFSKHAGSVYSELDRLILDKLYTSNVSDEEVRMFLQDNEHLLTLALRDMLKVYGFRFQ